MAIEVYVKTRKLFLRSFLKRSFGDNRIAICRYHSFVYYLAFDLPFPPAARKFQSGASGEHVTVLSRSRPVPHTREHLPGLSFRSFSPQEVELLSRIA